MGNTDGVYWLGGRKGGGTTIVQAPAVVVGSYTYDGTAQGPSVTWAEGARDNVTVTNATKVDPGTYTLTLALKDSTKMVWNDLTNAPKTYSYTIDKAPVTIPQVSVGTYYYTGSAQGPTITGDTSKITITNATRIAVGTSTLRLAITDADHYIWSDNTTADKTYSYTISQATPELTLSASTATLNASNPTATVTITKTGDGTLSASTSDDSVATGSISGTTLTISNVDKTTGTATITVKLSETTNYKSVSKTVAVTCTFTTIYGVQWSGGSETTWSRTDAAETFVNPTPAVGNGNGSSPFDNLMPWSGMKRVTDATAGTLVEIPKYYYKWTKSGNTMKLQIADGPADGFSVSPAHADRGDGKGERDVVYVGAYHCASTYKSTAGVKPVASITRATARTSIHNLGSTYWQYDFAMFWTIMMLYLVEYADWNSQKTIGYGCGNNSGTENNGLTDNMKYHTGTNASSRTTYGHVRYRYIEGLWDNVYDWCDGIYFKSADIYCIKNPANFSDTANGTKTGTRPTSSGYISAFGIPTAAGFGWALYPSAVAGSESTYVCDYCDYYSSGVVLRVGGGYGQYQYRGAFYLDGGSAASYSDAGIGCRLQKLP